MGNFLLNLSEKDRHRAFSKRRKSDEFEGSLRVDADALRVLGHIDPYADEHILEGDLATLSREIADKIKEHEHAINAVILEKTRKTEIEPWMKQMVLSQRDQDRTLRFLYDLEKMVNRAIAGNGTIIFLGD